jgi:N-acetylneuraminic acid mutarotase
MKSLRLLCGSLILLIFFISCEKTSETPITVTDIIPSEARIGETVQVIGTGFSTLKQDSGGVIRIYFEGVEVTGSYIHDTSIYVTVPVGAQNGPLCVMHEGIQICSPIPFTIIAGNPEPNSYMRLLDHPGAMANAAASVQSGKNIYIGHTNWWKYDIQKNTWTASPAPTDKVARATTFTINGKGYLFGGMTTAGPLSNRLQVFDESTNSWSFAAALPGNGRADAAVFVINNKAYIASGTDNVNSPGLNTAGKELWEYDPATNGWTKKADLIHPLEWGAFSIRIGSYAYLPGYAAVQEYNPATNSWRELASNGSWPMHGYTITDKDFELAYVLGGKYGTTPGSGNNSVYRVSLNFDRSQLLWQIYNGLPANGYNTLWSGAAHVYNNELYYGLGYTDPYVATETKAWWRYRY